MKKARHDVTTDYKTYALLKIRHKYYRKDTRFYKLSKQSTVGFKRCEIRNMPPKKNLFSVKKPQAITFRSTRLRLIYF